MNVDLLVYILFIFDLEIRTDILQWLISLFYFKDTSVFNVEERGQLIYL